ncbi:MAG: transporter related protein [Pedosphaera sp.]|nr:transporter related protein [Pedosphaera sp.]
MDTPAPNPDAPVIEMSGVAVGSSQNLDKVVLEDVNWTVQAGEYWVVGAMQGSGKSDLLSLTAGLTPPQRGIYRLFGYDMPIYEGALLSVRLRLGLAFDGGHLFHNLTVRENIALPFLYHNSFTRHQAEPKVNAMLEWTELSEWADNTPGSLGRNVQKRVGLARALMLRPEVLLLDNPLGGLDIRQMSWWLNFLGQLSTGHEFMEGRRVTLAVTAEDLRPWRERASHFAVLQSKRFIPLGGGRQLLDNTDPFVKELLAEVLPGI